MPLVPDIFPMPPSSWKKRFDALPTDHQNVLCFLAIHTAPMGRIRLQECCGYLDTAPIVQDGSQTFAGVPVSDDSWSSDKLDTTIEQLEQQGWIEFTAGKVPKCKSDLREQIVQHLYTTGQYQQFSNHWRAVFCRVIQ